MEFRSAKYNDWDQQKRQGRASQYSTFSLSTNNLKLKIHNSKLAYSQSVRVCGKKTKAFAVKSIVELSKSYWHYSWITGKFSC
jgi:hypothetical protein